jgi:hypothetical protein
VENTLIEIYFAYVAQDLVALRQICAMYQYLISVLLLLLWPLCNAVPSIHERDRTTALFSRFFKLVACS